MRSKKRRVVIGAAIVATINLVVNLGVILWVKDDRFRMIFTDLTFPLGGLLAAGVLFYAAWQWRGISARRFYAWAILGCAYLVFTLGDLIWAIREVGLQQSPFPSLADWFYIAFNPLFLFGILLLPTKRLSGTQWIRTVLDAAIILISTVMGIWIFVIGPTIEAGAGKPWIDIIKSILYPGGDILIMAALLRLLYLQREGQRAAAMLLIGASGICTIYTDSLFSHQTLTGTYISGGVLDIGWLVSYYLILLAGAWEVLTLDGSERENQKTQISDKQARWVTYLPYIWILTAYGILIYGLNHYLSIQYNVLIYWLGLLMGLALIRQSIMIEENVNLTGGLQKALEEGKLQEAALAQSNRALGDEIEIRKNVEAQLLHAAFHDHLTGLPNRALFLDHLMHSLEYAKRHSNYGFAVLFMDLDDFKLINDSLGHTFGDKMLMKLARILEACIRGSDIISRFGGDEFIFLIEDGAGVEGVTATANRILKIVSTPFEVEGQEVHLSASMGIVSYNPSYHQIEELMQDADIAMYRAKTHGKGKYELFHPEMRHQVWTPQAVKDELPDGH